MKKTKSIPTVLSHIIEIPKINDEGYLCFAENGKQMPFEIKRFYYIFDVKDNVQRGFHAHKKTKQVLFCIQGSITVILDDGQKREKIVLNQPNYGIFLDKLIWHEMVDFKKDTILLVAASDVYYESDYLRDYDGFLKYLQNKNRKWYEFVTLSPVKKLLGRNL